MIVVGKMRGGGAIVDARYLNAASSPYILKAFRGAGIVLEYLSPRPLSMANFAPTPTSLPPANVLIRLKELPGSLPNYHPLACPHSRVLHDPLIVVLT